MSRWSESLLAKSLAALALGCLIALIPVAVVGWQATEAVRHHYGEGFAENFTRLRAEAIREPIQRDLALAHRLAESVVLEEWLREPGEHTRRERFFREAEGYREAFLDGNYFVGRADNRGYYTNEEGRDYSEAPRYTLNPEDHAWFFNTLRQEEPFNVNVDVNPELGVTRVFINVLAELDDGPGAVVGTGFELSEFVERFVQADEAGVSPMVVDSGGAIQAHPDPERIAYDVVGRDQVGEERTLDGLFGPDDAAAMRDAMAESVETSGGPPTRWVTLEQREQLAAVDYIPELDWHVISVVDLQTAEISKAPWLRAATLSPIAALLILLGVFGYAVHRLLVRPLRTLQHSATAMAGGDFNVPLPPPRRDELGDLTHAFRVMADEIRSHTEELERRVQRRTRELERANEEMAASRKKIQDSIDYAGLIQRGLLPDSQMEAVFGPGDHGVLWLPRDGVGGDFYLCRGDERRFLFGVVDCAGHGVPGALMTMLARAAFDDVITRFGPDSPARLLQRIDERLRETVQRAEVPTSVATNLDAGLVMVDREEGLLRFAGARLGLYWCDGAAVGEFPGARRALCDRRKGEYSDVEVRPDPGTTYHLATDGYVDQAGGTEGLAMGPTRFRELLLEHAGLPVAEQPRALGAALEAYRGAYEQRDDVTVLSFRIAGTGHWRPGG